MWFGRRYRSLSAEVNLGDAVVSTRGHGRHEPSRIAVTVSTGHLLVQLSELQSWRVVRAQPFRFRWRIGRGTVYRVTVLVSGSALGSGKRHVTLTAPDLENLLHW